MGHFFLPRENVVSSYVVKDDDGVVTDFTSFYALNSSILNDPQHSKLYAAYAYYNFSKGNDPERLKGLIKDALILAKELEYDVFNMTEVLQHGHLKEELFFKPGDGGYPIFGTRYAKIGVYICYDRHFPEGARCLGLNGAEIVFNPSATVAGLSQYLWKVEQPAHAVANGYYVGAINRVGTEAPWNIGEFYGTSYFVNPRGEFLAQGSETDDEIVVADLDLNLIDEVRKTWQFYRDRRPEAYDEIVEI